MGMTTSLLPFDLWTETDLELAIIELAMACGWHVVHYRPARKADGTWSTPLRGMRGAPDLILARNGVVLLAELKGPKTRVESLQSAWLEAIGPAIGRLWRPRDWPDIQRELTAKAA